MKKFYALFFFAAAFCVNTTFAGAACTIGTDTVKFSPDPDNVPCAEIGVAYDEVLQFYIPTQEQISVLGQSVTAYIDSVVLNGITGLPAGLTWQSNPAGPMFLPGSNGCGRTVGTTNVAAGNYPIVFDGLIYAHGSFMGFSIDTFFTVEQYIQAEYGKSFSIDVIAPGTACPPVNGINNFNADLSSMLSVFPNPNNGRFELKLNATKRVNGEVVIVDVTGKRVYNEQLDVMGTYFNTVDLSNMPKGLYTVQLRTAEGFASKNISIE